MHWPFLLSTALLVHLIVFCQKTHCSLASYARFAADHSRCSILLCWEGISCNFASLFNVYFLSFFLCLSWLWLFSGAGYRWIFVILTAMRRFWRGY